MVPHLPTGLLYVHSMGSWRSLAEAGTFWVYTMTTKKYLETSVRVIAKGVCHAHRHDRRRTIGKWKKDPGLAE